jgi:hypothetical protein
MRNTKWLQKSLIALLFPAGQVMVLFIRMFMCSVGVAKFDMKSECWDGEIYSDCVEVKTIFFTNKHMNVMLQSSSERVCTYTRVCMCV